MATNDKTFLNGLPKDYVFCRLMRHPWQFNGAYKDGNRTIFQMECTNCGTVRNDYLDARLQLEHRSYEYADGYMQPRGEKQRFSVADVRRELLQRVKPKQL